MTTRNFRVNNGLEVGDIVISASANTITGGATAAPSADGQFANKKYVDDQAAATLTLSNKTLTAPKFADAGFIADASGNEQIIFQTIGSAVNELEISNAASGNGPILGASGETNVAINITPKGTGNILLNAGSDVVIPANKGLQFTDANEKIESDGTDLTINSGAKINLTATSDIHVPANVGVVFGTGEKIEGDSTDLTVTSGGALNLTATTDVVVPANVGVTFGTGEKIEGDNTDLTITSGGALNLTATTDVVVPANVGITYGTGEKIEGDNTDLTITSGAKINLTATSDIVVPANVGITFGSGEKIEGDSTDLTVTSGGALNLTATTDVVVPANVGITFGTGEKIEGNNTDLTVTSGADITLAATADINVPVNVGIRLGDGGENIETDNTDLTITSGGKINLATASDVHMANDRGIVFGDAGEKIEGDGTNLTITSSGLCTITATGNTAITNALTVGGNTTIAGNLTVNGDTTTVNTSNTTIADNLIELNTGISASSNDAGLIIERGSTGNNAAIIWDESADKFAMGLTTSTAADKSGGISVSVGTLLANLEGAVTGDVTGNADTATVGTTVTVSDNESTNENNVILFAAGAAGSGNLGVEADGNMTYNPSTGKITATGFVGDLTGDVTGNADTATLATTVTITDNESTNENNAMIFTAGGDTDGGNLGLESDGTCTYNPSTGKITATGFVGALTGNASGSSGSCTGNAATATALANARTIGGVSFDGTANINLAGVNSGGNQDTSGTAALATAVTVTANNTANEDIFICLVDGASGTQGIETDTGLKYNPSTNVIASTASSAQYADVAERFEADAPMETGSVVMVGGSAEITEINSEMSQDVFGVISHKPAYMMNAGAGSDESHPYVAMTGRTPVRVIGEVTKGQRLVTSSTKGCARAVAQGESFSPFNVIGRALETNAETNIKLVNCAVRSNN